MLSDKNSGYAGSPGQWRNFLSCWSRKLSDRKYLVDRNSIVDDDGVLMMVAQKESELGLILPRSYKDFLMVYRPAKIPFGFQQPGFLPIEDINRASKIFPEYVAELEENRIHSDDDEYFKYGVDQDDASGRTDNVRNALIIGRYSGDSFGIIVLYPQNKTRDGEMEASAFFHSGEFRAPSFAELMRQIHFMEVSGVGHIPPYAQPLLRGTCADELTLKDVWWK